MQWAILGAGAHAAQRIVPALAATPGEQLAGVLGSTPEKTRDFAKQFSCRAYADLAMLLDDPAVEAVFIATPNDQHRGQVLAAAAAGKHIIVEKPMALSAADCRAMIAAAEQAGVCLGLGFQQRHNPVYARLRSLITTGTLGEIVTIHAEWHTAYGAWNNWRADASRAGSDILGAVGVHLFDLVCWLAGAEVKDVASLVDRDPETGLDRTLTAALRFENGVMATASITRRARSVANGLWVYGTAGMAGGPQLLGMNADGRMVSVIGGEREAIELPMPDLCAAQFAAFARAVADGTEPNASGRDGLRSVLLSERLLAGG